MRAGCSWAEARARRQAVRSIDDERGRTLQHRLDGGAAVVGDGHSDGVGHQDLLAAAQDEGLDNGHRHGLLLDAAACSARAPLHLASACAGPAGQGSCWIIVNEQVGLPAGAVRQTGEGALRAHCPMIWAAASTFWLEAWAMALAYAVAKDPDADWSPAACTHRRMSSVCAVCGLAGRCRQAEASQQDAVHVQRQCSWPCHTSLENRSEHRAHQRSKAAWQERTAAVGAGRSLGRAGTCRRGCAGLGDRAGRGLGVALRKGCAGGGRGRGGCDAHSRSSGAAPAAGRQARAARCWSEGLTRPHQWQWSAPVQGSWAGEATQLGVAGWGWGGAGWGCGRHELSGRPRLLMDAGGLLYSSGMQLGARMLAGLRAADVQLATWRAGSLQATDALVCALALSVVSGSEHAWEEVAKGRAGAATPPA